MSNIIETHEISRMYKMGNNIVNALQSVSIASKEASMWRSWVRQDQENRP